MDPEQMSRIFAAGNTMWSDPAVDAKMLDWIGRAFGIDAVSGEAAFTKLLNDKGWSSEEALRNLKAWATDAGELDAGAPTRPTTAAVKKARTPRAPKGKGPTKAQLKKMAAVEGQVLGMPTGGAVGRAAKAAAIMDPTIEQATYNTFLRVIAGPAKVVKHLGRVGPQMGTAAAAFGKYTELFLEEPHSIAGGNMVGVVKETLQFARDSGHMNKPGVWTEPVVRDLLSSGDLTGASKGLPGPVRDFYEKAKAKAIPAGGLKKTGLPLHSQASKAAIAKTLAFMGGEEAAGAAGTTGVPAGTLLDDLAGGDTASGVRATGRHTKVRGLTAKRLRELRMEIAGGKRGPAAPLPTLEELAAGAEVPKASARQAARPRRVRGTTVGVAGADVGWQGKIAKFLRGGSKAAVSQKGLMKAIMGSPGALGMMMLLPMILDKVMGISQGRELAATTPTAAGLFAERKASRIMQDKLFRAMRRNPELGSQVMAQMAETQSTTQAAEGPVPGQVMFGGV